MQRVGTTVKVKERVGDHRVIKGGGMGQLCLEVREERRRHYFYRDRGKHGTFSVSKLEGKGLL